MKELKTFKDIVGEFESDCISSTAIESMIINKPLVGTNVYYLNRLRQEAIKWIKKMRYLEGVLPNQELSYEEWEKEMKGYEDYYDFEYDHFSLVISWIMLFFNISEEDLKDEKFKKCCEED